MDSLSIVVTSSIFDINTDCCDVEYIYSISQPSVLISNILDVTIIESRLSLISNIYDINTDFDMVEVFSIFASIYVDIENIRCLM